MTKLGPAKMVIPERFNCAAHLIDRHVEQSSVNKVAIYHRERTITYGELQERVNRSGAMLQSLGVERENRVLLLLLDCPEFIANFLGAVKIGAVPIPVNTMMTKKEYRHFLQDSRCKVLIISEELLPLIESLEKDSDSLYHIVVVGKRKEGLLCYEDLISSAVPQLEAVDTHKDDVCFWLYSSGSTGLPKGAVHLHHDMFYSAECDAKYALQMGEDDVTFSASKLFFAYGLGNSMFFPLHFGSSTILLSERPTPEKVLETITRYRPTMFFGVPTLYASLLEARLPDSSYDLTSLRVCVSAGEALPADIYYRWKEKFGIDILDGIGSTEVLHVYISNREGAIKPGSSGQIVPGYEAKIIDEHNNEVPRGEVGSLLIKGDSTAAYYWNNHEKTKHAMRGEWFYTGDMFYEDEDGYFWYAGRSDDMIKVGGIWVSPIEVENALAEHESVLECAVIGTPDEEALIKPKAFVVLRERHEPSTALAEQLQLFVKSTIAPYKYPRWIEFIPELPKTATGKIQRAKMREKEMIPS